MTNKIENLCDILTPQEISEFLGISYNSSLKLIKYNIGFVNIT